MREATVRRGGGRRKKEINDSNTRFPFFQHKIESASETKSTGIQVLVVRAYIVEYQDCIQI